MANSEVFTCREWKSLEQKYKKYSLKEIAKIKTEDRPQQDSEPRLEEGWAKTIVRFPLAGVKKRCSSTLSFTLIPISIYLILYY